MLGLNSKTLRRWDNERNVFIYCRVSTREQTASGLNDKRRELVKMNYDNYNKKVKVIEKELNNKDKKLSDKKINALKSKLLKRQRKL